MIDRDALLRECHGPVLLVGLSCSVAGIAATGATWWSVAAAGAQVVAVATAALLRRPPVPTPVVLEQVTVTAKCGLEVFATRDSRPTWPRTTIHVRRARGLTL